MSLNQKLAVYFAHTFRARGLTQEKLEAALHISQATLSDLCRAQVRWNVRHLELIAPHFGMTPGEFVTAAERFRPAKVQRRSSSLQSPASNLKRKAA